MLIEMIFVFCSNFSDKELCFERMVNCVITEKTPELTKKQIAVCKEVVNNGPKLDAPRTSVFISR